MNNLEWMYHNDKSFREYCQWVLKEHPLTFAMVFDTNEDVGEWLLSEHVDGANGTCPDDNGTASNDCGHIADMSEKSADCVRDGGGMSEDSREKLEADCEKLIRNIQRRIFSGRDAGALRCQLKELLDRQAAITAEEAADAWGDYSDSVQAEIAELQQQVDDLTAENTQLHAQCYGMDGLTASAKIRTLQRENANLAHDLGECMADRDRYRELCGQMLDAAHEMRRIADANMPEGAVL